MRYQKPFKLFEGMPLKGIVQRAPHRYVAKLTHADEMGKRCTEFLGVYPDPLSAAYAYNQRAFALWGEQVPLNELPPDFVPAARITREMNNEQKRKIEEPIILLASVETKICHGYRVVYLNRLIHEFIPISDRAWLKVWHTTIDKLSQAFDAYALAYLQGNSLEKHLTLYHLQQRGILEAIQEAKEWQAATL